MTNSDLKIRTKDYALSVIRLFAEFTEENGNSNPRAPIVTIWDLSWRAISVAVPNVFLIRACVRDVGRSWSCFVIVTSEKGR